MGKPQPQTEAEKLAAIIGVAREVIQEAREVTKDLRTAMKEARQMILDEMSALVRSEMKAGMEMAIQQINNNTDQAAKSTIHRYNSCTGILEKILATVMNSELIEQLATVMQLGQLVENGPAAETLLRTMRSAALAARGDLDLTETRAMLNGVPVGTRFPDIK